MTILRDLFYQVDMKGGTCSCPDQRHNQLVCKHIWCILLNKDKLLHTLEFEDLPERLRNAPHMVIDIRVVSDSQSLQGEKNLSFVEDFSSAEEEEEDEDQIVSQAQSHTQDKPPHLQNWKDLKARMDTFWYQEPQVREELFSSLSS
jgi:hypothetical protein